MEYSAGGTKYLLWYVETKETARLSLAYGWDEVKKIVIEDNLYQQKSEDRLRNEFGCIQKRIKSLPEELVKFLVHSDISTAKTITIIACMKADQLFFDFMYEVYRNKVFMGDECLTDADWNIFFENKQQQSEKIAKFTDATSAKLRQAYCKMLFEAGMLVKDGSKRMISKPFIEEELRYLLQSKGMELYLISLTGER